MELNEKSKEILKSIKPKEDPTITGNKDGDIEIKNATITGNIVKSRIDEVKNAISSLTDNDIFIVAITRLYNDGQEDRLSHLVIRNKFKNADIPITLDGWRDLLRQE
jgi:hypothetical protein